MHGCNQIQQGEGGVERGSNSSICSLSLDFSADQNNGRWQRRRWTGGRSALQPCSSLRRIRRSRCSGVPTGLTPTHSNISNVQCTIVHQLIVLYLFRFDMIAHCFDKQWLGPDPGKWGISLPLIFILNRWINTRRFLFQCSENCDPFLPLLLVLLAWPAKV